MAEKSFFHTFFLKAGIQFVQHVWKGMAIEFMAVREGEKIAMSQNMLSNHSKDRG